MKTTKIILATALISLGTCLYGQGCQFENIKVNYAEKNGRIESFFNGIMEFADGTLNRDFDEPVVSMSYTIDRGDIVFEEDLIMESWMSAPFESSVADAVLAVEKWMTTPFEAAENIEIESWMTTAWFYAD